MSVFEAHDSIFPFLQVEDKMMKPGRISEWYKKTKRCDVNLKLPKFKFEESYDLKEMLVKLGVTDMFDQSADFSGINGKLSTDSCIFCIFCLFCLFVLSLDVNVMIQY